MSTATLAPVPIVHFSGRFAGDRDVLFHEHAGTELVLVTSGACGVDVAGKRLDGKAGDLFVLPAKVQHNQVADGVATTVYCDVSVPAKALPETPRVITVGLNGLLHGWLEQLAQLQREPVSPAVRGGLALAVIETLNGIERREAHHRALHPGLVRALRRIETDLLEEMTVADLARSAGLSQSHLTALFRERFACGPLAYLQRQRLELACRLLRNDYLSIADVAASCGYADANYFARLFRQTFDCSPRTWREQAAT